MPLQAGENNHQNGYGQNRRDLFEDVHLLREPSLSPAKVSERLKSCR
jgi:hypothetical protein